LNLVDPRDIPDDSSSPGCTPKKTSFDEIPSVQTLAFGSDTILCAGCSSETHQRWMDDGGHLAAVRQEAPPFNVRLLTSLWLL
jgi:hypothetical protein